MPSNNQTPIHQSNFLANFKCLGDSCPDTCCKNWGMQIAAPTIAKYERNAPELLQAVSSENGVSIMKRDSCSDYCVKFEAGLCQIHRDYGEDFLGDACHFYPRSTRKLGDNIIMSAAISCPEITRLSLLQPLSESNYQNSNITRLPDSLSDYLPNELKADDALNLHKMLIDYAIKPDISAEAALINFNILLDALALQPPENWLEATPLYLKIADSRRASPAFNIADNFNLLNILVALVNVTTTQINPRLKQTLDEMQQSLNVSFEGGAMQIADDAAEKWLKSLTKWQNIWQHEQNDNFKKWLCAELALNLFPFSGGGDDFQTRLLIIAVRFATMRLAVMSYYINNDRAPNLEELTRIMQSLARFLDHLNDATNSIILYEQMGWFEQSRFNGLLLIQ